MLSVPTEFARTGVVSKAGEKVNYANQQQMCWVRFDAASAQSRTHGVAHCLAINTQHQTGGAVSWIDIFYEDIESR